MLSKCEFGLAVLWIKQSTQLIFSTATITETMFFGYVANVCVYFDLFQLTNRNAVICHTHLKVCCSLYLDSLCNDLSTPKVFKKMSSQFYFLQQNLRQKRKILKKKKKKIKMTKCYQKALFFMLKGK